MKTLKAVLLVIVICLSFANINYLLSQQTTIEVSGDITENTTWSDDTVKITGDITVLDNATLTINSGTYVEFQGYYCLNIKGRLLAVGYINDTIVFTINDTTSFSNLDVESGGWHGIRFDNSDYYLDDNDTSKLIGCRIEYGKATGTGDYINGGGVYISNFSKVIISDCIFNNNIAKGNGGGIYIYYFSDIIFKNNLVQNSNGFDGGGLYLGFRSDAVISKNIFKRNISHSYGGGICTEHTEAKIDKNIFCNNYCSVCGGGLSSVNSGNTITGNLIINNTAGGAGGGCDFVISSPEFYNNTVCNNYSRWGGGVRFYGLSEADFRNDVLWGNIESNTGSDEYNQINISSSNSIPDFHNCILQGGIDSIYTSGFTYKGEYTNIIELDPGFIDPTDGTGIDFDGLSGDWDIQNTSPCINHGSNEVTGSFISSTDIAGNQRIMHGQIDIGAYEKKIVKFQVSGIISENSEWIADTIEITGDIKVNDSITLLIAPGTYIEFQGYYKFVIEGTLLAIGTQEEPIWFTINNTTGFADKSVNDGGWWGISFDNSDNGAKGYMADNDTSKIIHCIIEYAKYHVLDWGLTGGGIKVTYFSRLIVQNNIIRNNSAFFGGGIGITTGSSPIIKGNIIYKNIADSHGGGIYCDGDTRACIVNNIISNNCIRIDTEELWPDGGGIYIGRSDPVFQNNVICNNSTTGSGGGIRLDHSNPLFANNTICNNYAGFMGGGMDIWDCAPKIYNSIIWGNTNGSSQSSQVSTGTDLDFYYCDIHGGRSEIGPFWYDYQGKTIGLNESDPLFVSPSQGAGIEYDGLSANWALSEFSTCINAGIPDATGIQLLSTDIAGNKRINWGIADIGAYESQADPVQITLQPVNRIGCVGDTVEFTVKTNVPAVFQWQKDGINIAAATGSILKIDSITIEDEGNYSCITANGYGEVQTNNVFLQVKLPPEVLLQTESQWIKKDVPMNLEIVPGGSPPLTFQWQKDSLNIPGAITPEYKIPYPDYNHEGDYTCMIKNPCGVTVTSPITIYIAPQICMVTVSTLTGNNLIVWEKNSIAPISYYNIYRESKYAGIYDLLATIPNDQLSVYTDSTADPAIRAYLYKITAVDTSGYEADMDLCKTHKTIHLLITMNPETKATQLDWDRYVGFDYGTYEIFRSDTTVNFLSIDAMSSSTSTWSDPDPGTGTKYYRVAALRPEPCYPTGTMGKKAESGPYSHSMSNIEDNRLQTGIFESFLLDENLMIYPNPFKETAILTFDNPEGFPYTLCLTNLSGKICRIIDNITSSEYELEKGNLKEGFYFVELRGPRIFRGKVIIE